MRLTIADMELAVRRCMDAHPTQGVALSEEARPVVDLYAQMFANGVESVDLGTLEPSLRSAIEPWLELEKGNSW